MRRGVHEIATTHDADAVSAQERRFMWQHIAPSAAGRGAQTIEAPTKMIEPHFLPNRAAQVLERGPGFRAPFFGKSLDQLIDRAGGEKIELVHRW